MLIIKDLTLVICKFTLSVYRKYKKEEKNKKILYILYARAREHYVIADERFINCLFSSISA